MTDKSKLRFLVPAAKRVMKLSKRSNELDHPVK